MKAGKDETPKAAPFGPVRKIKWLVGAAGRGELARADLAVLIVLADHINTDTGKAWPAYPRIAKAAGVSVRTAKRAIERLTALDLVLVAERGGPGRSNRYGLNWPLFEETGDGDTADTMLAAMVSGATAHGDTQGPKMVSGLSPDPINPSELKARDGLDRSEIDGGAAAAPLGACGPPPAGRGYEAFWEAWGRRVTVADTERLIDAAIDAGGNLADIIAGAERFRRYCTDTGKPARITPAGFVKGEKWRDDWQLIRNPPADKELGEDEQPAAKKTKKKKQRDKPEAADKPKRPAGWELNPDFIAWKARLDDENKKRVKAASDNYEAAIEAGADLPERYFSYYDYKLSQQFIEAEFNSGLIPPKWIKPDTGDKWGEFDWQRDKLWEISYWEAPSQDWVPSDGAEKFETDHQRVNRAVSNC